MRRIPLVRRPNGMAPSALLPLPSPCNTLHIAGKDAAADECQNLSKGPTMTSTSTPKSNGLLDIRKMRMDVISIITMLGVVIYFTWIASGERNDIRMELRSLSRNIESLANRVVVTEQTGVNWTRQDQANWCLQFQAANPKLSCPNPIYTQPPEMAPPPAAWRAPSQPAAKQPRPRPLFPF